MAGARVRPRQERGPRGAYKRRQTGERRALLAEACLVAGVDRAYGADGGLRPEVGDVYRRLRLAAIEESMTDEVEDDARLWARRGWPRDPRLADVPEGRRGAWDAAYAEEALRLGRDPRGPQGNDRRRLSLAILSLETGDPLAIQHVMDLRRAERLEDALEDAESICAADGDLVDGDLVDGDLADGVAAEVRIAREAGRRDLFTDRLVVVTQASLDEKFRRQRLRWSSMRSRPRGDGTHGSVEATGAEDQS